MTICIDLRDLVLLSTLVNWIFRHCTFEYIKNLTIFLTLFYFNKNLVLNFFVLIYSVTLGCNTSALCSQLALFYDLTLSLLVCAPSS